MQKEHLPLQLLILWITSSKIMMDATIIKRDDRSNVSASIQGLCSSEQRDKCLALMVQVTSDTRLSFPVNQWELQQTCRLYQASDHCLTRFMRKCTQSDQIAMVGEMLQGTKLVLNHLCEEGDFRKEYLLHSRCFKRIATRSCRKAIERFLNVSKMDSYQNADFEPSNNGLMEQSLHLFCCAYKSSFDCQLARAHQECDSRAVAFFRHYTTKMAQSLLVEHCLGYTFRNGCESMSYHGGNAPKINEKTVTQKWWFNRNQRQTSGSLPLKYLARMWIVAMILQLLMIIWL